MKILPPGLRRAPRPTACLLGAALVLGTGCSPTHDWREVRPAGTGLVGWMPCKPIERARPLELAGVRVAWTLWSCSAGGQTWGIGSGDLADPARVGAALLALREQVAANLGGGPAVVQPAAIPGATPQAAMSVARLQGRLPDGRPTQAQVVVFAHGTRVFQATAVGEQLPAQAVQTFTGALRLSP